MDRFEANQNEAAFNELRGFWENGTDPLQALNYMRTKYPDNALQYAAGELAFYRPRNDAYRVGDSFPELENFQFRTPRAPQVSPVAQDMGAQVANRAYAFTHQPQAVTPVILSDNDIVNGILRNQYGTGNDRIQALTNLGLSSADIKRIQGLVNARMYASRAVKSRPVPLRQRQLYQGMPMSGQYGIDSIY